VVSFKELSPTLGSSVKTKVVCLEKTHPDARFQKILDLKKDQWIWLIQRVRIIDGEAVILDTDLLNAEICPDITQKIAEDSLYQYLEGTLHLPIAYAEKEITCQSATEQDVRFLDMKNYDMVVNVESKTYLEDAKVFQYTSSRHRPDKFRFRDFARRHPKA
jgi:GntR family trehalose operon transcriptional repressor